MMPIDNEQRLRRTTIASSRSSPEGRTARVGFVAVICAALLSQACAAAFPVPRPEPIAPHLRFSVAAAEGGAPPTPIRRAPALPEPGGREEVELTSFLAYADARAPVLLVARSTRSRAAAARAAAAPALPTNPQVSVAVGPRVGLGGTGVDVQASFSQQFFIAGERGLRLDAADRQRDLTDAEIEQLRWAVHCDVHAAFHRAQRALRGRPRDRAVSPARGRSLRGRAILSPGGWRARAAGRGQPVGVLIHCTQLWTQEL